VTFLEHYGQLHAATIHRRRVRRLVEHIAPMLPHGARVLDIGCGDGELAVALSVRRPDVRIEGVDVLRRATARIPVREFDGLSLPYDPQSIDVALIVDVLHHTGDPRVLLADAGRVTRGLVVVKDHLLDGPCAGITLRFMDRLGNAPHGVPLPYNYYREAWWRETFRALGWAIESWVTSLGLYPFPASLVLDRRLHFVAGLRASN
jgi:SAM-dependent methyltransferase